MKLNDYIEAKKEEATPVILDETLVPQEIAPNRPVLFARQRRIDSGWEGLDEQAVKTAELRMQMDAYIVKDIILGMGRMRPMATTKEQAMEQEFNNGKD